MKTFGQVKNEVQQVLDTLWDFGMDYGAEALVCQVADAVGYQLPGAIVLDIGQYRFRLHKENWLEMGHEYSNLGQYELV